MEKQGDSLLKKVLPDLVIGIIGIPVALSFQNSSVSIIELEMSSFDTFRLLVISFLYLTSMYVLISFFILDIVHYPSKWARSSMRLTIPIFFLLSTTISLAILASYSDDLLQVRSIRTSSFLLICIPMLPTQLGDFKKRRISNYGTSTSLPSNSRVGLLPEIKDLRLLSVTVAGILHFLYLTYFPLAIQCSNSF